MSGDITSSEGLRELLVRLHAAGPRAWRDHPAASELMEFAMRKYGALARKHGLEPEDAAAAAFEVLRTRAVRTADDPWAVVTRAVQITLGAEERAIGLLCSASRARRMGGHGFHDAERFSERETPVYEYHPAFRVPAAQDGIGVGGQPSDIQQISTNAYDALDKSVALLAALGWPADTARSALEYICARLSDAGTRGNAHEVLRRDHHARALLDLDRRSWSTLLRVVLGSPNPDLSHTAAGRGLLLRLLIDEQPEDLLADDELVGAIHATAERFTGRTHA